jgi:hypothetical protein
MQRSWMLGAVIGLLLTSSVWGRPGIVKTRDGQTVTGDVTELTDEIIVESRGIHTTIDRDNLRSIAYSDTIEQECRKRVAKLTPYDVAGRVELAQWLFENKAYEMARGILHDAAQIQPRNLDVIEMTRTVERQILLEQTEARKHAPIQLAAADGVPPAGAMPAAAGADHPAGERLLTPEEINQIKHDEWLQGQMVRVNFKDDVRRKYIAKEGLDPATFNRMTPADQGWAIVQNGTPEMKKDVLLANDPPVMATFKRVQQSLIGTACMSCHTVGKAQGNFALHLPNDDAAVYTNFMILQKYQKKLGDRTYLMIDRSRPEDSLLVQFSLPLDIGQPPHPKAQNYKGAVHTKADPRLKAAIDWISALNPVVPDYSEIDLQPKKPGEHPIVPSPATRPTAPGR